MVNPYADTAGDDVDRPGGHAARVADLVRASGAHLGAVIDPDGEHLTIVDDEGTVLTDDEALLVLLRLVVDTRPGARVALPVAVQPGGRADLRAAAGAEIVWTKLSAAHLMEVSAPGA